MKPLVIIAFTIATALCSQARPWKSADGRTIDGEFVNRTATEVTIQTTGQETKKIPLDRLHADDRIWLDKNHPLQSSSLKNSSAVFDQLFFGDDRKQVEEKMKASKFVHLTVDETFIGRSGLNGVFRTTQKIGNLEASLDFDFTENNKLREITLYTDPIASAEIQEILIPCWSEFIKLLTGLYGKPEYSEPAIHTSSIPNNSYAPTHLWKLSPVGSVTLGASRENGNYKVVVRFSQKKVELMSIP